MVSAAKFAKAERDLRPARAFGAGANGENWQLCLDEIYLVTILICVVWIMHLPYVNSNLPCLDPRTIQVKWRCDFPRNVQVLVLCSPILWAQTVRCVISLKIANAMRSWWSQLVPYMYMVYPSSRKVAVAIAVLCRRHLVDKRVTYVLGLFLVCVPFSTQVLYMCMFILHVVSWHCFRLPS